MTALRVTIVGFGKIARDQHVPAIAATDAGGLPIAAEFDFRRAGPQSSDILVETGGGLLTLSGGGARLVAGGEVLVDAAEAEYRGLQRRFVELTRTGASDVDPIPFRLVADAFMPGRRRIVEAFEE
jgi:D-galactose 1-dehydrogenase